jgi:hypothetical protein
VDAGIDSLSSLSLRRSISKAFCTPLPVTLVFDYPTLGEITNHLKPQVPVERRQSIWMGEPHVAIAPTPVAPPRAAEAPPMTSGDVVWPMTRGAAVMICADCVEQTRALTSSLAD